MSTIFAIVVIAVAAAGVVSFAWWALSGIGGGE